MTDIGFGGFPQNNNTQPVTSTNNANTAVGQGTVQINALVRPDQVVNATPNSEAANTRNDNTFTDAPRNAALLDRNPLVPTAEDATDRNIETNVSYDSDAGNFFFLISLSSSEFFRVPAESSLPLLRELSDANEDRGDALQEIRQQFADS